MSAAFDVTCATCGDTFQQSVKRGGGNIRHCRYCNRHSPDKQLRTQAQRLVSKAHRNMRANTKRINYLQAFCTVCGTGYTVSGTQVHQTRTCSKQCRQKQPHIIETKERLNRKRVERLKANPDLLAKERERQREDSRRRSSDPGRIAWMGSWQAKYNQREDVKERKRQRSAKNKEHLLAKRIEQMWASGASSVVPITHPCRSQERAEKSREYYINNKEKYYAAAYRRRARMYDNGEVHNINRLAVFDRDNYTCRVCSVKVHLSVPKGHKHKAILGHINALAAGGTHTWDNVCTLCHQCNTKDGVNRIPIQTTLVM